MGYWVIGLIAVVGVTASSCSGASDEASAREATTTTAVVPATEASVTPTPATTEASAPTTTEAATTTIAVTTTEAPTTTTIAVTTTVDPLEADAALIRRLVYEQQQFMAEFGVRGDWTGDDYIEYTAYMHDRTEPAFRQVIDEVCSNHFELDREYFSSVPTQNEPDVFARWSVDLSTLQPDPTWTASILGVELLPAGRTYIVTAEITSLTGDSTTQDVHMNVQNNEAFWFFGPFTGEDCIPA